MARHQCDSLWAKTKVRLDPPATHSIRSNKQYIWLSGLEIQLDLRLESGPGRALGGTFCEIYLLEGKFGAQKGDYPPGAKTVLKVTFFEKKFVVNGATDFFQKL